MITRLKSLICKTAKQKCKAKWDYYQINSETAVGMELLMGLNFWHFSVLDLFDFSFPLLVFFFLALFWHFQGVNRTKKFVHLCYQALTLALARIYSKKNAHKSSGHKYNSIHSSWTPCAAILLSLKLALIVRFLAKYEYAFAIPSLYEYLRTLRPFTPLLLCIYSVGLHDRCY